MNLYYTEYEDKVIFKNKSNIIEVPRETLKKFLRAIYKKYGTSIKFRKMEVKNG